MIYPVDSAIHLLNNRDQVYTRAVNPSCLQILRLDEIRDDKYDVIMTTAHDIICEKNCTKKILLELSHLTLLAYFPPTTLLLTCILQWHTGVCDEMFDVNSKIAQTKY